ncbi:MAG: hypothetical protein CMM41_02495 [Rhodospirillaceae bacterium]|nr:hypothetical protein [Rhodospirillaceae bacterium]|tara:strand:- start:657 stop:1445 length:789 start_codon:yes stop_codon:yes gene_type:complete
MTQQPIVGITACRTEISGKPAHRVSEKYVDALKRATDCIPLLIPAFGDINFSSQIIERLDGLLLTGSGSNVEPARYNGTPSRTGTAHDAHRDGTSLPLIRSAVESKLPIFAVCRGIQELNVALGGSLHQNIHELTGKNEHRMNRAADNEERFSVRHPIAIQPNGLLSKLVNGSEQEMVNSLHGQAIDRLSDQLIAEATSDDGVIEAVSLRSGNSFVLGVQWHPEYPLDHNCEMAIRLFEAFDRAAKEHLNSRQYSTNDIDAA